MKVLVLGYLVRFPLGGMAWHYLQYALGLRRLGHEVLFLEDSEDYPCCYDPSRHVTDTDPTYGLRFAASVLDRVGLGDRWAYYDAHADRWHGPVGAGTPRACEDANLALNISGANPIRPWLEAVPVRAFIDTDPAFEQIRQLTVDERRQRASLHNVFFTFGENIERGLARVPADGHEWKATRQPIVLEHWPATPGNPDGRFTTIMQWDSYPVREYDGMRYGMKADSFEDIADLPRSVEARLELALGSESAPRERLRQKGWWVTDPLATTRTPWSYRAYIRRSKAEFGVAKHGYVAGYTGWFSERSAAYLASGRPVVAMDTGFTEWAGVGEGLLAFGTFEEAVAAIEDVNARYRAHVRAAREVAEEYFDSDRVLGRLLERAVG